MGLLLWGFFACFLTFFNFYYYLIFESCNFCYWYTMNENSFFIPSKEVFDLSFNDRFNELFEYFNHEKLPLLINLSERILSNFISEKFGCLQERLFEINNKFEDIFNNLFVNIEIEVDKKEQIIYDNIVENLLKN